MQTKCPTVNGMPRFLLLYTHRYMTYLNKWGCIKWSTICSPTKNTSKIKSKSIHMIFDYPTWYSILASEKMISHKIDFDPSCLSWQSCMSWRINKCSNKKAHSKNWNKKSHKQHHSNNEDEHNKMFPVSWGTYQCLKLSSISSMTTGWLQFNVFPGHQQMMHRV